MKNLKKEKIGFFFTDASLDHKTKNVKVSIIDIISNDKKQFNYTTNSIVEAESYSIICALKEGLKKYKNIIVFNDNLYAVKKVKKDIFSKDNIFLNKYYFVQIVWIPREYNQIADFFSKNIDNQKKEKEQKVNSYIQYINRNEIVVTTVDKISFLKDMILNDNNEKNIKSLKLFTNKEEFLFIQEILNLFIFNQTLSEKELEGLFINLLNKYDKNKYDLVSFLYKLKIKISYFCNKKSKREFFILFFNLLNDIILDYINKALFNKEKESF